MYGISGILISQPITENITALILLVIYAVTIKKEL